MTNKKNKQAKKKQQAAKAAAESEANGSTEQYVSISDLRLAAVASGIPLVCANRKA